MNRVCAIVVATTVALTGCGSGPGPRWADSRDTCLVLSVGHMKGVAHVGAIQAVQDAGVEIDCVVGNSMGSLIGALYATAPNEPIAERLDSMLGNYVARTESEARDRATLGGFFGVLLGAFTGGLGAVVVGGVLGAAAGASTTERMDHGRAIGVLNRLLGGIDVGDTAIPFATFHHSVQGAGIRLVKSEADENLARAVGNSIANPFIFRQIDIRRTRRVDPGADRVAATPIQDACDAFPETGLIAINVTGQPAFYNEAMRCPLVLVDVDLGDVDPVAVIQQGGEYRRVVRAGYVATCRALGEDNCERRARRATPEPITREELRALAQEVRRRQEAREGE